MLKASSTKDFGCSEEDCRSSHSADHTLSAECSYASLSSSEDACYQSDEAQYASYLSTRGLESCTPLKLLGNGSTCRVELVEVEVPGSSLPLLAARKTMLRSRDSHIRAREDQVFAREVEGLRTGSHCPCFVRQLAAAAHTDRHELLLELAEGQTLEHELSDALRAFRGEPTSLLLPAPRLAAVAASLLTALAALHGAGMAHLDVKPANLLLTAEGRVLLGDTGCAARLGPDGRMRAPAGTPLYAAPEVKACGAAGFTAAADMYSAGVLLAVCAAWHRMTGRVLAFLRGAAPLPAHVPDSLRDLIERLTAANPAARPSAAEALAHPFLAGVDLQALAPLRRPGLPPI